MRIDYARRGSFKNFGSRTDTKTPSPNPFPRRRGRGLGDQRVSDYC